MKLDEINMPIFLEAYKIAYNRYFNFAATDQTSYELMMEDIRKATNLNYHQMIEAVLYIKG